MITLALLGKYLAVAPEEGGELDCEETRTEVILIGRQFNGCEIMEQIWEFKDEITAAAAVHRFLSLGDYGLGDGAKKLMDWAVEEGVVKGHSHLEKFMAILKEIGIAERVHVDTDDDGWKSMELAIEFDETGRVTY